MNLADHINAELLRLRLHPLISEQLACLADPGRIEEAVAMLDDLRARCGVRLPVPEGVEFGPFKDEEEAREEARERAADFDAVAVDEMATDDSRSYGGNEYYVTGYKGRDVALLAAARPEVVAYWVGSEEHSC
jgi:hypothetical protein